MLRTCLQPSHRRRCPTTTLCAAMWHQSSTWTTRLLPDLLHMLLCRYASTYHMLFHWCLSATASSISTCKLLGHGLQFMVDLTTRDFMTTSLISLRIPPGLLQRNGPKSYSTGAHVFDVRCVSTTTPPAEPRNYVNLDMFLMFGASMSSQLQNHAWHDGVWCTSTTSSPAPILSFIW